MLSQLSLDSLHVVAYGSGLGAGHGGFGSRHPVPETPQHVLETVELKKKAGQSLTPSTCMRIKEQCLQLILNYTWLIELVTTAIIPRKHCRYSLRL